MCKNNEITKMLSIEELKNLRAHYQNRVNDYRKEISVLETLIDCLDNRIVKCENKEFY